MLDNNVNKRRKKMETLIAIPLIITLIIVYLIQQDRINE
jgi:hypothetical protein